MTWINGEYHPRQKRSEEKKSRIMDAALELFSTEGFHGTTAKAIAARAGVATGSFYRFFRDKKAAFLAVCARMEQELGGCIFRHGEQLRQEGLPEAEILASLVHFAVTAHHRHRGFQREVLAMQITDPDLAAWSKEREQRVLSTLLDFLSTRRSDYRVQDLEAAAELILYSIEEVSHRGALFASPVGEERLIRELQDMLKRYLFD
jgi:AcrR family transcriptional regulator